MTASPHPIAHILVVDPDVDSGRMLALYLPGFGYRVTVAATLADLDECLPAQAPDLIVADSALLAGNAGRAGQALRERTATPFILLCGAATSGDRADGLDSGAHDVMSKPFEPRELVARVQAVLRRVKVRADQRAGDQTVRVGRWMLDTRERRLFSEQGVNVSLSLAEYRLLMTFVSQPARVRSRDELMDLARGRHLDAFERSIDLLVSRLRQKLGDDPREPALIRTVRGQGYVYNAPN
ncbi:winged helix-turn-helix domain-containing protein [Aquabacterium sp.]|uniref:winged helix-turn-helix domain-containing protein n=1 Tax=Aquabacterium sp. TaxID=1872578 RepID=UPI0035AF172D